MLWLLLKIALFLLLAIVGLVCYKHYSTMQRAKFYEKQGVVMIPGFDNFFVGNAKQFAEYELKNSEASKKNLKPLKPPLLAI